MLQKIKFSISLLAVLFTIFYINNKVDENILFFADNSTKFFQGLAVVYNNFNDDIIRCQWLKELNYCDFFFITTTMSKKGKEILGAFPFSVSYINAFIIKYLGSQWILWLPEILFVILILLLYFYRCIDEKFILLLSFATPLLFQFYTLLDIAFQIFFLSFFWIYYYKLQNQKLSFFLALVLGFITGLNFFFRVEGIFYISVLMSLLVLFDKNYKFHLFFSFGILISLLLLFGFNFYYYGNPLGNRILVNRDLILNFKYNSKLWNSISLLWGTSWRVGFFQYMPILLLVYFFAFMYFKRLHSFWKMQFVSIIISLFLILLLAPNDSNVDYGSRYLSTLILPSFLLFDYLKKENFLRKTLLFRIFTSILIFVSVYFSYKYLIRMIIKVNLDFSNIYQQIPNEYKKNVVWSFHSNFSPSAFGAYLVDNTSIVLEHSYEVEEALKILKNKKEFIKVLIFHSYFYLDPTAPDERRLSDRLFYEDETTKQELLKGLKELGFSYTKKELYVRERKVFDLYLLQR